MPTLHEELAEIIKHSPSPVPDTCLRKIIALGLMRLGAEEGSLLLFDAQTNDLVFRLTVTAEGKSIRRLIGLRIPANSSVGGAAFLTGLIQMEKTRYAGHKNKTGIHDCVLAVPWIIFGYRAGILSAVRTKKGKPFSQDDVDAYAELARVVAAIGEARIDSMRLAAVIKKFSAFTSRDSRRIPTEDLLSKLIFEKYSGIRISERMRHSAFDEILHEIMTALGGDLDELILELSGLLNHLSRVHHQRDAAILSIQSINRFLSGLAK